MVPKSISPLLLCLALALGACSDGAEQPSEPTSEAPAAALPDGLFVDAAPQGAKNVSDVKAAAKEGDVVVVRGRVGGPAPFVPGRAVLTVADTEKLVACSDREHDPCPKPWDYCCESKDDIAANSATIQVVGADGRPLKVGLEGAGGIEPLSFVVVEGSVGPRHDGNVLVIDARRIHVER